MNIGNVSYMNYLTESGRAGTQPLKIPEPVYTGHGYPVQSPGSINSGLMPGQGSYLLFVSPDGDRAEISSGLLEALETQGVCHTCENRKYVDKSDDASVSFQTPTNISPNMAAAAVVSHENEHVRNEQARAHRDGREIVNQTVTLTYDCCPECGKNYVSGGTTKSTSVKKSESDEGEAFEEIFNNEASSNAGQDD